MALQKKRIDQVEEVLVDQETREVLDGHLIYFPKREKAEGWFMAWQEGFEALAKDKEMTMEARRVLDYAFSRIAYENHMAETQADIAKELDMKPSCVSRAIKLLLKKDILRVGIKIGRSCTYVLNDNYGWKGRLKTLRKFQKKQEEEVC